MIGGVMREFRDFALKGNMLDLAVAVIIGTAFGKVVESLTRDILLPPIGKIFGQPNFDGVQLWVLNIGSFLNALVNFLIVAFCIFLVVKAFNTLKKRFEGEKPAAAPAGPTKDQQLLMEIRDLLAKR